MKDTRKCIVCLKNKENLTNLELNKSYFRFPLSPRRRKKWYDSLQLQESEVKCKSHVCELHFHRQHFIRTRLKPTAIPSLHSHILNSLREKSQRVSLVPVSLNVVPCGNTNTIPFTTISSANNQPSQFTSLRPFGLLQAAIQTPVSAGQMDKKYGENSWEKLATIKLQRLRKQGQEDKRRIRRLRSRVENLKAKLKMRVDIREVFSKNSTFRKLIETQVERYKKKAQPYTDFEKTAALSLYYSCGVNGYQTLQKMGIALPCRSSLQKWTADFQVLPGVNQRLLTCIQDIVSKYNQMDKDCMLTWDEMSIKELVEYNKFYDKFEGLVDFATHGRKLEAANEALVFMIRGINSTWKFPISYYFSRHATTSEMLDILVKENVKSVQKIGLKIRIAVCDMSFTNQGLYRAWEISRCKPSMEIEGSKIYFIHDTPHLIKLVRNNLMKHDFLYDDKNRLDKYKRVKWSHITRFYCKDRRISARMAPRITKCHIYVRDFSKMKVKLASQVLSHSVFSGIMAMCRSRILKKEFEVTARFVKKVDEMFDFLNMSSLKNDKWGRCAYYFYNNFYKFDEYQFFLDSITIPTYPRDEPEFIKGLQLTLSGIKLLAVDLQTEGYTYLLTRNIQQDCLENFFSLLRYKGGSCVNPSARSFRTNFRFLLFANLIHIPTSGNTDHTTSRFSKSVDNMHSFVTSISIQNSRKESIEQSDLLNDSDLNSSEAASFYAVKLSRRLKLGKEQESLVAAYMGGACINAGIKHTKCSICREMITSKDAISPTRLHKYVLIDFKKFNSMSNNLVYLRSDDVSFFEYLTTTFDKVTCDALSYDGKKVLERILNLYEKDEKVSNWLKVNCYSHRQCILRYFFRAKLFRLIKDKNEAIRQSKSFSQNRRDLRNQ